MNLRRVILYSDVGARHSPMSVLHRWKEHIDSTIWNISHFYDGSKTFHHQLKQRRFIKKCWNQLLEEGRHWTFSLDPDEFLAFEPSFWQKNSSMMHGNVSTLVMPSSDEPGHILKDLEHRKQFVVEEDLGNVTTRGLGTVVPSPPCIYIPRINYGNKENDPLSPSIIDDDFLSKIHIHPSQLQTHRYSHWKGLVNGKGVVDLSRPKNRRDATVNTWLNPHKVDDKRNCGEDMEKRRNHAWGGLGRVPYVINHYPASWEQLLFRSHDSRNGGNATLFVENRYRKFSGWKHKSSNEIQGWVKGFVSNVGVKEAGRLLKDSGLAEKAAHS